MSRSRRSATAAGVVIVAATVSACVPRIPSPLSADEGSDDPIEAARAAVVRIESQGTFVDPGEGEVANTAGSGSGFIIDESGLAVTNNHVVTGAAILRVYLDGESDPRNARVVGASECSDIAVIDIDGEDFRSLDWATGDPRAGTSVYAAGYPLGDEEFTLTRGIVSRGASDSETSWASVSSAVLHDATINTGSSGGPLLDDDGRVIGVNYAGDSDIGQFFAITADEVVPLLDRLGAGETVTSIGVNGEAFILEDDVSGVWVYSVESGSPADQAGIEGGDIITRLENLVLGADGTMSDYCDILRGNGPGDVLSVEVFRAGTGDILSGSINGRPIEVQSPLADELAREGAGAGDEGEESYDRYVTIQDQSGTVSARVPAEWDEVDGSLRTLGNGEPTPTLWAAPVLDEVRGGWGGPGLLLQSARDWSRLESRALFDLAVSEIANGECTRNDVEPYDDGTHTGFYEVLSDCAGTGSLLGITALHPADRSYGVVVAVQVVSQRDIDAAIEILRSFTVRY